jgi:hypothetical protein
MSKSLMGYADLHMHTTASDGKPELLELLRFISQKRRHLNVIAITDHDTLDASLRALELQHHYGFEVVPGVEVTSRDGHVLALWVTTPIPRGMSIDDTVHAIHDAGGLAILAHPFHAFLGEYHNPMMRYLRNPEVLLQARLDAIEAHNAGICGTGCNTIAAHYAHRNGFAVVGGSDAHTTGAIGSGITRFQGTCARDLRTAISNRATLAEGQPWSITDYITYFKHDRQRKEMISSAIISSSAIQSS